MKPHRSEGEGRLLPDAKHVKRKNTVRPRRGRGRVKRTVPLLLPYPDGTPWKAVQVCPILLQVMGRVLWGKGISVGEKTLQLLGRELRKGKGGTN